MRRLLQFLAIYLGFSIALGLLWLLLPFANTPTSISGWAWLLLLALPIQLGAEFLGDLLWKNKVAQAIEIQTEQQSFSWLRIAYGVLHFGVIIGGLFALTFLFGAQ